MDRKEYKQAFDRERYERIELKVPKGMKSIIKSLANDKGMSVNAYLQDLVRKDQCGMFDTMQIAERNREMISGITGNMHDGFPHFLSWYAWTIRKPFSAVLVLQYALCRFRVCKAAWHKGFCPSICPCWRAFSASFCRGNRDTL